MELRLSKEDEIKNLTQISKAAFDTDINVGGDEVGGPPNYDSKAWHIRMMKSNNLYTLIVDERVIGGIILFRDKREKNVMYVGRIFIDPQLHRKGYGIEAMKLIEKYFSDIHTWRLETPTWNIRTNQFYKKIGYKVMEKKGDSVYYQKIIQTDNTL